MGGWCVGGGREGVRDSSQAESVLIIDPAAGTTGTSSMTGLAGSDKWYGGVLAGDGRCTAFLPALSRCRSSTRLRALPTQQHDGPGRRSQVGWWGVGGDGKVYGIPIRWIGRSSTRLRALRHEQHDGPSRIEVAGGVLAGDGKVYGITFNADRC